MKKINLLIVFTAITTSTFAQEFKSAIYAYGGMKLEYPQVARSNFRLGYLQQKQNGARHNFNGSFSNGFQGMVLDLKYAYDIRLAKAGRFNVYISPYLNTILIREKATSFSDYEYIGLGLQPSTEFSLSNRVQLIAALPVSFFGATRYEDLNTLKNVVGFQYGSRSQLNFGVRANLFGKRFAKK